MRAALGFGVVGILGFKGRISSMGLVIGIEKENRLYTKQGNAMGL